MKNDARIANQAGLEMARAGIEASLEFIMPFSKSIRIFNARIASMVLSQSILKCVFKGAENEWLGIYQGPNRVNGNCLILNATLTFKGQYNMIWQTDSQFALTTS